MNATNDGPDLTVDTMDVILTLEAHTYVFIAMHLYLIKQLPFS